MPLPDEPYRPERRRRAGGTRRTTRTINTSPLSETRYRTRAGDTPPRPMGEPSRLGTPRDAGMTLGGDVRTREERRRAARQRQRVHLMALATIVVVLGAYTGWRYLRPEHAQNAALSPLAAETAEAVAADPTPLFASYRSMQIYLPVPDAQLTEIAFHQAASDKALHMTSLLPDADSEAAKNKQGTGRGETTATATTTASTATVATVSDSSAGPAVLGGSVIRMWRSSRSGPCDSAVDVGAPEGTDVFSPVSGTVVEVRPYMLYDKYEDVEVHIRPDGWPEVDVVLIHIDDVSVEVGDQVTGGVTRVAAVRKLSDKFEHQLGEYTKDGGNHVHVQLNPVESQGMLPAVGESQD